VKPTVRPRGSTRIWQEPSDSGSPTLLVVARLDINSSYAGNFEEPADEAFDTVQFFSRPFGGRLADPRSRYVTRSTADRAPPQR
jgi:hypothetical protein